MNTNTNWFCIKQLLMGSLLAFAMIFCSRATADETGTQQIQAIYGGEVKDIDVTELNSRP